VGNSQLQTAMSLLGLGGDAAKNITSLASDSRAESNQLTQQKQAQLNTGISAAVKAIWGGGGDSGGDDGGDG